MTTRPISLLPLSLLLACGGKTAQPEAAPEMPTMTADPVEMARAADRATSASAAKELLASLDATADPCTDFYRYACGGWMDSTTRPEDQASWTRSFSVINERNREILKEILERAAADPGADDGDWMRIGNYYGSCMDQAAADAAGLTPVQPVLDAIAGLNAASDLPAVLATLHGAGIALAFDLERWGDLKNPDINSAYASQSGLGLPDRDYYLKDDEGSVALQAAYKNHVAKMLVLGGADPEAAAADADAIYAFEYKIAEFSLPKADMRDPNRIYNPRSSEELAKIAPTLDIPAMAAALGLTLEQPLVLHDEGWFKALDTLVAETDASVLKAWLRWHTLSDMASALPDSFGAETFAFYGQQVYGQAQRKDRWKRCVDSTNRTLGDALSKHYVATQFAGDSKEKALTMVDDIKQSFVDELPNIDWMDDATRTAAAEKSGTLVEKIGFPDSWKDTSTMAIEAQPYGANVLAARRWVVLDELAKIGQPVDSSEWFMPASMVNAYYNPTENEMVFPAGILQPPFFHRAFPDAMNYGAIGMVIGHELTHGFDDEGRKFDKDGKLTEWWAPEVSERFEERAQCVIDQYNNFEGVDGMKVNGELTTGENIADLGGIELAHRAWSTRTKDYMFPVFAAGLTHEQTLFVAYAQGWCTLMSPELEKLLITSNPHSPPRFRVNGPLQNFPAFHQAFSCEAGDAMVREPMCDVW